MCGESCCTKELEKEAYKQNQLSVDKYIRGSISKISSILDTRARKFDDMFQSMMKKSKREFHEMFERTYGKIYLKNSDVFSDFFDELETYYKKGTVRLSDTMDTFFGILYQRMFTVINAQYTFDDAYLDCVSSHMAEMKPFGDVPHKLGMQLRRSFVATRTFYKSLVKGADAAERLTALRIEEGCFRESARMRYCGTCQGGGVLGPCSLYCTSTMQECLKYHMELSPYWDNFVDAIDKVGDRLLGPYAIEIVVEPLNIKISEAIMNFQESGADVSKKIYTLCGKPTFSRPKREADNEETTEDDPDMEIKFEASQLPKKKKHKKAPATNEDQSPLEKIIFEIKQKVKETKQFWLQLPYQYCNNLALMNNVNESSQCWNSTDTNATRSDVSQSKVNIADQPILSEQTYILQGLTDKLRKAHQGQEVEMVDDTEEVLDGSGSGSGDGAEEEEETTPEEEEVDDKGLTFTEIKGEEDEARVRVAFPPTTTTSTREPEVILTSSASPTSSMSLTRALFTYLLPMVLAWFGGAITNLL
ncbi:glypican-6 isoform X2 [Leptinotarsa decemlineata]